MAAATSEAEGRTHIKIIAIFVQVMGGNFSIGHLRSQWRKREKWRRERGTKVTRVPERAALSASKQIVSKSKVPNERTA